MDDPQTPMPDRIAMMEEWMAAFAAQLQNLQKQIEELKRPDRKPDSDLWPDYRDAAEMIRCPKQYLRERAADGSYLYWPEIERWQPGGPRTRLFVRREHVEARIERSRTPAPCPIKREFSGIGYESALPALRRLGADRLIRKLGLEK